MYSDQPPGFNPYAPPAGSDAVVAPPYDVGDQTLADRGTRLGARILDNLLAIAAMVPGFAALLFGIVDAAPRPNQPDNFLLAMGIALLIGLVFVLPLAIYQWTLISRHGQTLGKRWTGIRIVRLDGSPVDFRSGVLMREWFLGVLGFIPYLGGVIHLVDLLMIFANDRRCLHDLLAGTKVIVA